MNKILVTGADGFIGSHLTEKLLDKKNKVRALTLYNSFNSWGWLEGLSHQNLEVISGDIRDPHFCNYITKGIDIVFHLAALIAIPYSYVSPDSYIDTNVRGTLNICQASKENRVKRVLVTSTSEVYGTAQYVPIDEKHPKQPQSPYSASKVGADMIALSFFHAFELPVVIVRPFNTYGPRQSSRAIIPTVITQIADGFKEIKIGDLSPTRDLSYVTDTCRGFEMLAQCDDAIGQEINIASNSEISMKSTSDLIVRIMGAEVKFIQDNQRLRPSNSEVYRLCGDNTKIRNLCGYKPQITLEEGLQKTVEWFLDRNNLSKYKSNGYNI